MGSLPNLNELCREKEKRRAVEKERDLVRERARQQGFNRGDNNKDMAKDRLPMLFQVWIQKLKQCNVAAFYVKTNSAPKEERPNTYTHIHTQNEMKNRTVYKKIKRKSKTFAGLKTYCRDSRFSITLIFLFGYLSGA